MELSRKGLNVMDNSLLHELPPAAHPLAHAVGDEHDGQLHHSNPNSDG